MSMTPIPCRSPRGPPPLWLKNFKSQRVYLETPWVSTGIWWVSASCVCYALGFLRVFSKPPWVSTSICPFVLTFLWFCCGFPQVCLHCVFTSIWCCYRFACDILMYLLHRPLCVPSRNDRRQCGCGSVGFPVDVLRVSIGFPASFLRVSGGMLLGFLQVSCGFPIGFLLFPQWVHTKFSGGFPIGFRLSACGFLRVRFLWGFQRVSCGFPVGCLQVF